MSEKSVGRFVWYELMTSDPKAAIAFYTEVIGWKTESFRPDYTMWVGGQGPLGGVMTLPEQAVKLGAPPHWMSNVTVADVDATVKRVTELGGKVIVEPKDIPEIGRYSIVTDPQGAVISMLQALTEMAAHDTSKPDEFTWSELMTTDHLAALKFYGAIFGWEKTGTHDMGEMGEYLMYGRDGKTFGGMFTKPKNMPMPPCWLYYVHVADLDAALERAKAKGARVQNGPMDVPGGARIAQLTDPQGAWFALHADAKPADAKLRRARSTHVTTRPRR